LTKFAVPGSMVWIRDSNYIKYYYYSSMNPRIRAYTSGDLSKSVRHHVKILFTIYIVDELLWIYIFVKRYSKQKSDQIFYNTDEKHNTILLWFRAWTFLEIKFINEIYTANQYVLLFNTITVPILRYTIRNLIPIFYLGLIYNYSTGGAYIILF